MTGTGDAAGLERRYRRLLAWYPRDHQAEHADEMLGVLLAGARDGQSRPGAGESASLLAGAARIRLRHATGSLRGPRWQDPLAVVSVLAPVLLLAWSTEATLPWLVSGSFLRSGTGPIVDKGELFMVAGSLAVTALVLLRWRRAATVAATVTVAGQVLVFAVRVRTGWWFAGAPFAPVQMFLGVLTLAVLQCSDGPRRGLEVLGRWRSGLIIGGALTLVAANAVWARYLPGSMRVVSGPALFALVAVGVPIAGVVLALRSPAGRRVILLTAPGLSPEVVFLLARILAGTNDVGPGSLMWILYLVLAIVVTALATATRTLPGGAGRAPSDGHQPAQHHLTPAPPPHAADPGG